MTNQAACLEVLIVCPVAYRPVKTGDCLNPKAFEGLRSTDREFRCRRCGETHTWSKDVAWLAPSAGEWQFGVWANGS